MRKQHLIVLGVAGFAGFAGPAAAEKHAVAARAGLLGLGIEYTYEISDRIAVRGGINGSQVGFDSAESGIDYEFDLIWDSVSLAVDFHPTRGPLRLTAGLLQNDNRLEAVSRVADEFEIGSTVYTPAEVGTLALRGGFDSTAPYVGLGWDWSRRAERFGVSFDLGVVSQGDPRVSLSATGSLLGDPGFQADLAAEETALEGDIDGFDLMPFASVGLVFRF